MSRPREYRRIILGKGSDYAAEGLQEGWIGGGWGFDRDLGRELGDDWRDFNKRLIPEYLIRNPDKSKVSAGLACGMLWSISKGIEKGDYVLTPDGTGTYHVGEVTGLYYYHEGHDLMHRRRVNWFATIERAAMSEPLRNSSGSVGTVSNITKHAAEIERLLKGTAQPVLMTSDEAIEDPSVFALEQHLEHFLIQNWAQTDLGRLYDIFEEDGEMVGQQYPSDTGPIDILAISKDRSELLVVELKRGRASDAVVGQVQRYMGYVKDELTNEGQTVRGVIIALEEDLRLRRALSVTQGIDFYRYQVSFKLLKGGA